LDQHLGEIQVDSRLECHGQRVRAVVVGLRYHVEHVFDAVDLLLERRSHGFGDDPGIGARVIALHHDAGRRDLGILGDRQVDNGDGARQGDDD
jgi:hypothetical protein